MWARPIGAGRGRDAGGASARRGDAGAQPGLGARSRAARVGNASLSRMIARQAVPVPEAEQEGQGTYWDLGA
jgi:hypothetical protein